jgi:hypothetical protein
VQQSVKRERFAQRCPSHHRRRRAPVQIIGWSQAPIDSLNDILVEQGVFSLQATDKKGLAATVVVLPHRRGVSSCNVYMWGEGGVGVGVGGDPCAHLLQVISCCRQGLQLQWLPLAPLCHKEQAVHFALPTICGRVDLQACRCGAQVLNVGIKSEMVARQALPGLDQHISTRTGFIIYLEIKRFFLHVGVCHVFNPGTSGNLARNY